jgi:hypothetical protein
MPALVSVILPLASENFYLHNALDSISKQNFCNFELIVLMPSDLKENEKQFLDTISHKHTRLSDYPAGMSKAGKLNRAMAEVTTPYIVIAGSSDVAVEGRLEALVNYMDQNPSVDVCGSNIYEAESGISKRFPVNQNEIACRLFFSCGMAENSLIYRASVFQESGFRFRDTYEGIEEYELLCRLSRECRLHNLEQVLLYSYRKNADDKRESHAFRSQVRSFFVERLNIFGIHPTTQELKLQTDLFDPGLAPKLSNPLLYKYWFDRLDEKNKINARYPEKEFENELAWQWRQLSKYMLSHSPRRATQYLRAEGLSDANIWWQILKSQIKKKIGRK